MKKPIKIGIPTLVPRYGVIAGNIWKKQVPNNIPTPKLINNLILFFDQLLTNGNKPPIADMRNMRKRQPKKVIILLSRKDSGLLQK